jgi:excisionase family DNA binding protein
MVALSLLTQPDEDAPQSDAGLQVTALDLERLLSLVERIEVLPAILTPDQVQKLLSISRPTLYELARQDRLPGKFLAGKQLRWVTSTLLASIAKKNQ